MCARARPIPPPTFPAGSLFVREAFCHRNERCRTTGVERIAGSFDGVLRAAVLKARAMREAALEAGAARAALMAEAERSQQAEAELRDQLAAAEAKVRIRSYRGILSKGWILRGARRRLTAGGTILLPLLQPPTDYLRLPRVQLPVCYHCFSCRRA
eukprot:736668-Prorocentrum_minimum.AAC.6